MGTLATGRRIKCLTSEDDFTNEYLTITAEFGVLGVQDTRILDSIALFHGYPATIRTDQGPEFTCRTLEQWAFEHGVELRLIQQGKLTQDGFIDSFNVRFRDECRPHSSLDYQTPAEFAAGWRNGKYEKTNRHY